MLDNTVILTETTCTPGFPRCACCFIMSRIICHKGKGYSGIVGFPDGNVPFKSF